MSNLLKEYTRKDQEYILSPEISDKFTISYEIELVSNEKIVENPEEKDPITLRGGMSTREFFRNNSEAYTALEKINHLYCKKQFGVYAIEHCQRILIANAAIIFFEKNPREYNTFKKAFDEIPNENRIQYIENIFDYDEAVALLVKHYRLSENEIEKKILEREPDFISDLTKKIPFFLKLLFSRHFIHLSDSSPDLPHLEEIWDRQFLFIQFGKFPTILNKITHAIRYGTRAIEDVLDKNTTLAWYYSHLSELSSTVAETELENMITVIKNAVYEYMTSHTDAMFHRHTGQNFEKDLKLNDPAYFFFLNKHLPRFTAKYKELIDIEPDISLPTQHNMEISMKTYIQGLNKAIEFISDFYDEFQTQKNFFMKEGLTGLHINIGYEGQENKKRPYNVLKGYLLLNETSDAKKQPIAYRGLSSERVESQWAGPLSGAAKKAKVNIINDMMVAAGLNEMSFEEVQEYFLNDLVKSAKEGNISKLEDILSQSLVDHVRENGVKNFGFNIGYTTGRFDSEFGQMVNLNPSVRYVEFRYPGGKVSKESIIDLTKYYSFLVFAMVNQKYKQKEYLTKLVGYMNVIQAEKPDRTVFNKFLTSPGSSFYVPTSTLGNDTNYYHLYLYVNTIKYCVEQDVEFDREMLSNIEYAESLFYDIDISDSAGKQSTKFFMDACPLVKIIDQQPYGCLIKHLALDHKNNYKIEVVENIMTSEKLFMDADEIKMNSWLFKSKEKLPMVRKLRQNKQKFDSIEQFINSHDIYLYDYNSESFLNQLEKIKRAYHG